jgi:hypothetical protein
MILISHFWSFQPFHFSLTLMNSQIQMANLFFIYSFMFSLLATFTVTSATETDIYCLKSIRDSMIDPNGYLNTTWISTTKQKVSSVDLWESTAGILMRTES